MTHAKLCKLFHKSLLVFWTLWPFCHFRSYRFRQEVVFLDHNVLKLFLQRGNTVKQKRSVCRNSNSLVAAYPSQVLKRIYFLINKVKQISTLSELANIYCGFRMWFPFIFYYYL